MVAGLLLLSTSCNATKLTKGKGGIADDMAFPKDYPGTYYTERLAPKSDYIAPWHQTHMEPTTDATPFESPRTYTMPTAESYKPMV